MSNNIFGVDLGTSNIKLFNKSTNVILNEKNVIAIEKKKQIYGIGDEAYEMFEKAPDSINVIFPMQGGVIADYKNMQLLLSAFLNKIGKGKSKGAEYIVAVPTDITEVEKKTFVDVVKGTKLKPKLVEVVEKPIAAAVGLDLDVTEARGIMVVDIGSDTSEISVLSLGGIVISKLLPSGGIKLDDSIVLAVKKEYNLVIGRKTAQKIKQEIGDVLLSEEPVVMKAFGRDIVTGLPMQLEISSELVYSAMSEHIKMLIDSIKVILEKTPPELSADIIEDGIYLTGGGSKLKNLDKIIESITELKVNKCSEPESSVVKGLMKIATTKTLRSLAYEKRFKPYK